MKDSTLNIISKCIFVLFGLVVIGYSYINQYLKPETIAFVLFFLFIVETAVSQKRITIAQQKR